MRIMAIDYGDAHTGVALSDPTGFLTGSTRTIHSRSARVVLDELVESKADALALGILPGDIVAFDPRTVVTESGFIKSRFLDDKLSVAILLGYARHLKETNTKPQRKIYQHITVFEEVGHGGSGPVPADVAGVLGGEKRCGGERRVWHGPPGARWA